MLKQERQRQIVELLGAEGKLIAAELSSRLGVSEDTIRRDLWELDAEGKIMRVHGGALSRLPQTVPYTERKGLQVEGKSAVGRAAAALVKSGQLLFLDGGTTTLQVARSIPKSFRLTVVTNSPPIAAELNEHPSVEIILLGGRLLKESQVVVGQETVEQIQQFHADLLFLGTCAIHRKAGITIPHLEEASVKRALMQCAIDAVVVATADKLNTTAPYVVAPVEDLSYLVTEASAGEPVLKKYRKLGITVLTA
jgi:DeoR/GlpR family transcriptional regulator of sugar metabolism